ncbi:low molecular weight phosphotyrosine protein phosphatase [Shewanella sp. A32]|uniref:low molecular weight protein-tyrosine-phosphatase n=1 Tax=Shewanella sp. A32 TaxID=3031327 RepID=UPI0023B8A78A|nr:low molecular weight protein-tyrosine-phosphatase [Shewanella sp. A32]MDF0533680.1 low molecular weight phosphotyrosine protein phosphatase [Shewanella sp. A32]
MGNICRSPTADAVARIKAAEYGLDLIVDSAGTIGYHQGEAPDRRARQAGQKRGLDFTNMRARQVIDADFARFDLILAADRQNLGDLQQRCPNVYQHKLGLILAFVDEEVKEVPDPYYGGDTGFERVLDLLELAMAGLFSRISNR